MDFRKRFPLRLGRPGVDEEVDGELEFHLAMRRREFLAQGLTEEDARRRAMDRFGDFTRARQECRAIARQREQRMRVLQYVSELWQDAAFAVRQMRAAPAFTLVALATLALGIGATTAIFSAVHAVVLRPLPVHEPDRLVVVNSTWRDGLMSVAPGHFLHFAAEQTMFEHVAALERSSFTLAALTGEEGAERVIGGRVSGRFFDVFGVGAAYGRVFGSAEDEPGRDGVVVLSHRLWTGRFGSDPTIVGRELTLNQRKYTVIGIMPGAFDFTSTSEALWVPIAFTPERKGMRGNHFLTVYARLRAGVSIEQANDQVVAIATRRVGLWPNESAERSFRVSPLMERFVGDYRQRVLVLFGAVAVVLLIACGNVSNLLLARGALRGRELALRTALGAGQGRLVRQLFTESIVLGLAACVAAMFVAQGLIDLLVAFGPPDVPRLEQTRIDATVLAFNIAIGLAASVVFGLVPAWRASRGDVNTALKDGARGAGARGARDSVRSALIAVEVALALVLLVGAGLLIRTSMEMQRIDLGFEPRGVFTGRLLLPAVRYRDAGSLLRVTQELEAGFARMPGVTSAAIVSTVPFVRSFSNGLLPEGRALDLKNITQSDGVMVSPAYFATLRLPILRGRSFTDADRAGSPLVVILNRTAAQQMWPAEDAIGKRLTSANPLGPTTVIGIAADVPLGGPSEPVPPTFYVPFAQMNDEAWGWSRAVFIAARTDGNPAALAPAARRIVSGVDPGIPLFSTLTMEERMRATIETARFNTMLLTLLGVTGLLLAAIGIYGVIAYFATERTSEIGIRIALGANRGDVVRMVVGQAAVPVACGVALGALGAVFASRALESQLVNVQTTDPITFSAVAAALVLVALAAALIPARRAAALDPARALQTS